MKRGNGSGTVYKKKDKIRRNPFVATITVGWTYNGIQKRKTLGCFATQKDAWNALTEYARNPTKFDSKNMTFSDMWEMMKKEKKRQQCKIDTSYSMVYNHCKAIWSVPIQSIKTMTLQQLIDDSGLKHSAKTRMKVLLNAVWKLALANDIVDKNYAALTNTGISEQSIMHKPFTTVELQTLWNHTNDDTVKIMLIYIYTGARPIELLKMPLSDIHLADRYMVGGVKTRAGKNRSIPIAECIFPFVKYFFNQSAFNSDKRLFSIANITLLKYIKKECSLLKIGPHLPHDCRHTFITMAENYHMEEKNIKLIVGHAHSGDTTQDVYTHKTIQQLIQSVNMLPYGINMLLYPDENNEKVGATGELP